MRQIVIMSVSVAIMGFVSLASAVPRTGPVSVTQSTTATSSTQTQLLGARVVTSSQLVAPRASPVPGR
jgi:hypothetical protein